MAGNRRATVTLHFASREKSGRRTPKQIEQDLICLTELGRVLDERPPGLKGGTIGDWLIWALLRIRNKSGLLVPLRLNESQRQISRKWKKRNIILKARQLGDYDIRRCTIFYRGGYASWSRGSPGGA